MFLLKEIVYIKVEDNANKRGPFLSTIIVIMLISLCYLWLPGIVGPEISQILENNKMVLIKAITGTHSAVKFVLNFTNNFHAV